VNVEQLSKLASPIRPRRKMIWVPGQVGIDAAMKPATGTEAQAQLAFQGLRSVLEAGEGGGSRPT
jgi:enamine deaminase RidA (YjgF/YER057c/UK114 family)